MPRAMSQASSCHGSRRTIESTAIAIRSTNTHGPSARHSAKAMQSAPRHLFVTRYFWPELIGSAPFTSDIAEWLARHAGPTTVLSGLPHYPSADVFPAYRDGRRRRETVGEVTVERLRSGAPRKASTLARIMNEADFLILGLAALAS